MPLLFEHGIRRKAKKNRIKEVTQGRLRQKVGLEDENVVIIEKSNMVKFLIRTCGNIVHVMAAILICGLAFIGLTALIYPGPRAELESIAWDVLQQLIILVGGG